MIKSTKNLIVDKINLLTTNKEQSQMGMVLSKRVYITLTISHRGSRYDHGDYEYLGQGRIRNIRTGAIHDMNQKGMGHRAVDGFPDVKGGLCHRINAEMPWAFTY